MLAEADLGAFRRAVEDQSLRHLRRYLDYGKRARHGAGLTELHRWLGRILLDRDAVYDVADKASAFEIAACEWLALHWDELNHPDRGVVTIAGVVDKVLLVRLIVAAATPAERGGLAALFAERYRRTWAWVGERVAQLTPDGPNAATPGDADAADGTSRLPGDDRGADEAGVDDLFLRFLEHLERLDPLPRGSAAEQERRLHEAAEREERLRREVAATTDRAERAAARAEGLQEELSQLRRSVRDERDAAEKLREERSRRIKLERQARDAAQELERLKAEYLKLDARLRQAAQHDAGGAPPASNLAELAQLAQVDPHRLLGLPADAAQAELAQVRRRFAAAFHSDRAAQLPTWVRELFDQLLAVVNAACDRTKR